MKSGRLAIARVGEGDAEVGADVTGIAAEHDDAIGQQDGLFDVVRHDEDGARGDGLLLPQLQQLAAQVLGGEHVERGERFVHEENFRLDHQGAGEADALPHAAGELFGKGGLESVETDGVENAEAALAGAPPRPCRGPSAALRRSQVR